MTDCAMRARALTGVRGILFACLLGACTVQPGTADPELEQGAQAAQSAATARIDLDVRRSLVVTEQPILARFTFERVLEQLVAQARVPGLTAFELFLQWWDTNNPASGGLGLGPNCDTAGINAAPFSCRPAGEGQQTQCDSLRDPDCAYIPIGLFNRFDLAPADGAHCGEHRIVFAKQSGVRDFRSRNLIIFEAILPNPLPQQGLKGCRKIVESWAELSAITSLEERARRLEKLYFDGHGNVPPVVHVAHFGDNPLGAGQVRTNQFVSPAGSGLPWSLREFKLKKSGCPGFRCALRMLPVTVKNNPVGALFAGSSAQSLDFERHFTASSVASLSAGRLADIAMNTPDKFNAAQSNAGGTENDYPANFAGNARLATAIQGALGTRSTLTPAQLVARAGTQSCAGCHQLSNGAELGNGLVWPSSLGFVHVSERQTEVVGGVTRHVLSPALLGTFLPARKQVMEAYLKNQPGRFGAPRSLGGRYTH